MQFTVKMPKLSPTMTEGMIAKWHKKEGEYIEAGDLLLEIATDKATVEFNALDEGWLRRTLAAEGQTVPISQPIAIFTETKDEAFEAGAKEEKLQKVPTKQKEFVAAEKEMRRPIASNERIKASPLAKKLAIEKGVDLATIHGTGPGGRITSKDLETVTTALPVSQATKEIPLTPMRALIAKRLQESKSTIPHFYVKQTLNALLLSEFKEQFKHFSSKITINDLLIKACALALKQHPDVNRGFNAPGKSILQYQSIDISVAVSVKEGLITPIIRNADQKPVPKISEEVKQLAQRARAGKLKEEEYLGGSFCLSNLGMYGITEFTAVINPPQAAILAVGGIIEAPVVKDGQIKIGKLMNLTLSADHRVIDGALAAQFIKTVQNYLENPSVLLL